MAAVNFSPAFNQSSFIDANGDALAGAKIFQYEAGSFSVLKATYTTAEGDVGNPNPIVLDSAGCLPNSTAIWLERNEFYNLVLTQADGTTVLKNFDYVTGVTIPSTNPGADSPVWVVVEGGTYLSPTQFLVPGNFVSQFGPGNRVRVTLSTGFTYGLVTASAFSGGNTTVTIINDGPVLNASLSVTEFSVLIANGETVDAAGVSFFSAFPYSTSNTVGNKLKAIDTDIAAVEARRARGQLIYTTGGTGDAYQISPTPAISTYASEATWDIKFSNASSGASTLSINGLAATALKQYTSVGALVDAVITAGMVSQVAYDGTSSAFILLDSLPPTAATTPRGMQVFTSNGTFTVPDGVSYLKITCVGGGGGGGGGSLAGDIESGFYPVSGVGGGGACTSIRSTSTSGGTSYSVAVGAAGTAGPYAGAGGAGGTSSFGVSLCTAGGGAGGTPSGGGAGSAAGTGSLVLGGTSGITGARGMPAQTGQSYGTGGQPGSGSAGGAGSPGVVYVEW